MAYTTDAKIRMRSGVTTAEVSSTNMTAVIAWGDNEIDEIVDSVYYYNEYFDNMGDDRIIAMNNNTTVSNFKKVEIDGTELFEVEKKELMDNCEIEEVDSGATGGVEDWESASDTSATYTHSTTAHRGRRSLLITSAAQETAYWQTTDNIEVEFPQDNNIPAYKASVYIKTTSVTAGDGSGAYFDILWYNGSDTLLATDSGSADAVTTTNDWTQVTLTKYAPDTASHAKVRVINDGESGTAYFDTLSFRKVNWITSTSDANLIFARPHSGKFISVLYENTGAINPLIENLATDLCARAALVHAGGGTVQGLTYQIDVLKVSKGKQSMERMRMINQLTQDIQAKMGRLSEQGLLKDVKNDWFVGLNNID